MKINTKTFNSFPWTRGCDKSHTQFATNLHKMHKSSEYFILIQNDHIFVQFSLFKCILKLQTKTMIHMVVNDLCSQDKSEHKKHKYVQNIYTYVASNEIRNLNENEWFVAYFMWYKFIVWANEDWSKTYCIVLQTSWMIREKFISWKE